MRAWGGGFWKKYRPTPFTGWDEDKVPDAILVSYPISETDDQRKQRIKLGLPLKTYSFTVERINDGPTERKRSENQKSSGRIPAGFDNAYSADGGE